MEQRRANQFGKYPCACCGYHTLSDAAVGGYEICPVCGWEDDPVQLREPELAGGANRPSLQSARRNFEQLGRSEPECPLELRSPLPVELPRHAPG